MASWSLLTPGIEDLLFSMEKCGEWPFALQGHTHRHEVMSHASCMTQHSYNNVFSFYLPQHCTKDGPHAALSTHHSHLSALTKDYTLVSVQGM